MQIFIMRHGQADMVAPTDALRPLSAIGVTEASMIGQWLLVNVSTIDAIFISPYLRAQQTANAVLDVLGDIAYKETVNFITPEDSPKDVHDYLDSVCSEKQFQKVLLVSHMPLVSYLVAELTTDNTMPIFQTASVAQIDYDADRMQGQLVGLVSPNDISHG